MPRRLRPPGRRSVRALGVICLVAGALAVPTPSALAWSPGGHMVLGAITYAELQRIDPEALERVLDVFESHPHYGQLFDGPADRQLDREARRVALFARAGRWADDVRRPPWDQHSRPMWHYVNFLYRPPATLDPPRGPARDGYLLWALEENHRLVESGSGPVRAVALAWLFHLIADLHQPLHNIALVDAAHPDGDRGGNLSYVRTEAGGESIDLHWLWDGLVHGDETFDTALARARDLRATVPVVRVDVQGEPAELFRAWSEEGARVAIDAVYLGGELVTGPEDDGVVVPPGYLEAARQSAEQRAVLGAVRLAHLLARWF